MFRKESAQMGIGLRSLGREPNRTLELIDRILHILKPYIRLCKSGPCACGVGIDRSRTVELRDRLLIITQGHGKSAQIYIGIYTPRIHRYGIFKGFFGAIRVIDRDIGDTEQIMRSGIARILTHHFPRNLKRLISLACIERAFKQYAERFDGRLAFCKRMQLCGAQLLIIRRGVSAGHAIDRCSDSRDANEGGKQSPARKHHAFKTIQTD
jgi:hypothetical protein